MREISPKVLQKIETLAQIAAELRQGERFKVTRLTLLKGLCDDPQAAAQFALYLAKKTRQRMKSSAHRSTRKDQQFYRLVNKGIRELAAYLRNPTDEQRRTLRQAHTEAQNAQNRFERQRWGSVRIVESRELLIVETALECVLRPWASADFGYRLARQYAEEFDVHYGSGLLPDSAPMVEEITEFWGRHFLGREWRKQLQR